MKLPSFAILAVALASLANAAAVSSSESSVTSITPSSSESSVTSVTPSSSESSVTSVTPSSSKSPVTSASATTTTPPAATITPAPDCIGAAKYEDLYHWTGVPDCRALVEDCKAKAQSTTFLWSKTSCVAAAVCTGAYKVNTFGRCANPAVPVQSQASHLSYNIYANIVGSCAWQDGGCPITPQNFIDFYYGAISAIGGTIWPPSTDFVITNYWQPILDWTKTGNTLPYTNFDDWLHYSYSWP